MVGTEQLLQLKYVAAVEVTYYEGSGKAKVSSQVGGMG